MSTRRAAHRAPPSALNLPDAPRGENDQTITEDESLVQFSVSSDGSGGPQGGGPQGGGAGRAEIQPFTERSWSELPQRLERGLKLGPLQISGSFGEGDLGSEGCSPLSPSVFLALTSVDGDGGPDQGFLAASQIPGNLAPPPAPVFGQGGTRQGSQEQEPLEFASAPAQVLSVPRGRQTAEVASAPSLKELSLLPLSSMGSGESFAGQFALGSFGGGSFKGSFGMSDDDGDGEVEVQGGAALDATGFDDWNDGMEVQCRQAPIFIRAFFSCTFFS